MQLRLLLDSVPQARLTGDPEMAIRGLAYDSRAVEDGFLFAAIRGMARDGHDFIPQAIEKGAVAILSSRPATDGPADVAWVQVDDDRLGLALAARNYYGRPDSRLTMLGITGTNGKTTVAFLLESVLREAGLKPSLIGTVLYRNGREEHRAQRTTPESLDLYRLLDRFTTGGTRSCVMEVSSHSLVLRRVAGIEFRAGVFTNLTQDHLDFHKTMGAYLEAKSILFSGLGSDALAILNTDDEHAATIRAATRARVVTFGTAPGADVRVADVRAMTAGTEITLHLSRNLDPDAADRPLEIRSPLLGRPNAMNIAAAAATGIGLGLPREAILRGLAGVTGVDGRFERVDDGGPFTVLVDYAHTDDALKHLLAAVREWQPRRIITVFGCGGDRDRSKRPRMGYAAASGSDVVVVTSDNPRGEDPLAIIDGILPGVREGQTGDPLGALDERCCLTVPDRKDAIHQALSLAEKDDCVVIAGKGHETYQILGDRTIPFDDREVARDMLRALGRERSGRATR
ncbi:MAG: UDP-N-acetylmuramoyl-L-alanyl-D-glutamate--2,6-diaminopimelate ligase [Acidobacteria bacterium]|nr:UDP-N-acetylmuramoyl-L-alanyl-D-glutamate--2,6-diaminopimelate ligase [Acidobacteriota bacterium]